MLESPAAVPNQKPRMKHHKHYFWDCFFVMLLCFVLRVSVSTENYDCAPKLSGGSYIVQEHWNVEKSRAMDYMRFGGQYEKMRRLLGSTTGTDYELVASDLIEKGDNTTDPEALDIIMKELNVLVEGVSEQLDNKYAGSA